MAMFSFIGSSVTSPSLVFAGAGHYAENELLLPTAPCVPGHVSGPRHSPGPALTSAYFSSPHHPVGRRPGPGIPPCPRHLQLPRKPAGRERLPGASEFGGPVLPLSCVRHPSLGAGVLHCGAGVGVALLGEGRFHVFYFHYLFSNEGT